MNVMNSDAYVILDISYSWLGNPKHDTYLNTSFHFSHPHEFWLALPVVEPYVCSAANHRYH